VVQVLHGIAEGQVKQQQLLVDSQSSRAHCRLVHDRGPGKVPMRLVLRISYSFEVEERPPGKFATLTTGKDPFLTLSIADEERTWVLHADQVCGWVEGHRRFLQRFSDDLKWEVRMPRRKRRRRCLRSRRAVDKFDARMKTWRQQTAAQVVGHALRRGCSEVVYDDRDRDALGEDFCWFALREAIRQKCEQEGLAFRQVTGDTDALVSAGASDNGDE
jgi:hypothetical protein